ncbi:trigger factor [Novipirellula artificiosorum]|uniref:Trigger factor n=1 Tax=Novipirellula artificiosorum TaxID=2528016 RepID=A0A5C6DUK2_9BACT|nr:trigger factor [Novipirellula artificiosorum]TWU41043.1 Trigger factor [Novipirellula artificiosorum]
MSTSTESETTQVPEEKKPVQLEAKVESPSACLREVIVTIPHAEVERYLKDAYDEIVPEASVAGFRAGRAPRKLVEKQFRDRVREQVKGTLLMDSLAQVSENENFSAIGEPDFDFESIELPEEGDFKYQFSIEVRPDFETPTWKGLELSKPVEEISDDDVQESLERVLGRYATLEATDEAAELGDKLVVTIKFSDEGKFLSQIEEERITFCKRLSLSDGVIEDFGTLMKDVTEGETRTGKVKVSEGASIEAMRGKEIDAEITVIEVLKSELPKLTESFLEELGDFESEQELRGFVRDSLTRQADYRTQQSLRESVVEKLAGSADFELPESLVQRQTQRELQRKVLELRRSGFDEDNIRRFVNASRQNAKASTEAALREHFILEKIAEEENVDAEAGDYDAEIALIAQQSDMAERKVRARLEKSGQMDAIRNQIVERKVIEMIVEAAKVSEEKVEKSGGDEDDEFAVYHSVLATREEASIPEAKYEDNTPKAAEKETEKD